MEVRSEVRAVIPAEIGRVWETVTAVEDYAAWRRDVWAARLSGLRQAGTPDEAQIRQAEEALVAYAALTAKEETSC